MASLKPGPMAPMWLKAIPLISVSVCWPLPAVLEAFGLHVTSLASWPLAVVTGTAFVLVFVPFRSRDVVTAVSKYVPPRHRRGR